MCGRSESGDETNEEGERRQRLFFALWPDETARQSLGRIGREALSFPSRLVPAENLHLTLVFLGSMSREQRRCAEQVASEVRGSTFTLCFDRLGVWPRPRVLWCAPSQAPPALLQLVNELTCGLAARGLAVPTRPYRAHLTLARKVTSRAVPHTHRPVSWYVSAFQLVASQTLPQGARYRVLACWPLIA
jgi:2'-5' RNA ligase